MKIAVCLYGKYSEWFKRNEYNADIFAFSFDSIKDTSIFTESDFIREPITDLIPQIKTSKQQTHLSLMYNFCIQKLTKMLIHKGPYDMVIYAKFSDIILSLPVRNGVYCTKFYSFQQNVFPNPLESIDIISNTFVRYNGGDVVNLYSLDKNILTRLFRILYTNKVQLYDEFIKGTDSQSKCNDVQYNTTFLIPSVINVSVNPFDYTNYRSVFSHSERFNQTYEQVLSLSRLPESKSYVLEGSHLDLNQLDVLHTKTTVILFSDSIGYNLANVNKNKSLYEIYVMASMLPYINSYWYFKFGARYNLAYNFDLSVFTQAVPVLNKIDKEYTYGNEDIMECILYSFPNSLKSEFINIYEQIFTESSITGKSIESLLIQKIKIFQKIDCLGIIGNDAIQAFPRLV